MLQEPPASLIRELNKLTKINSVLMERVERSMDKQGNAFSLFQTAITLEGQVRARTEELTQALRSLERTNAQLLATKEEAEKANLSKTRFLAAASHDLLQPVNAAKLLISTLADLQRTAEGRRLTEQIDNSLSVIEDLIKTLLDISKLDAGVVKPEIRRFALDDLLSSVQSTFECTVRASNIRFVVRPSGLTVLSDPVLLHRLLQNLVCNAIRYTQRGGVLVGVRPRGGYCHLDVVDTGPGISDSERERIFDEFWRGSTAKQSKKTGLGLGLSIVKRISQALGHELTLTSAVGKGSRFRVSVPTVGKVSEQPIEASDRDVNLAGIYVLLVENDATVGCALSQFLERLGCRMHVAAGLSEVRELLDGLERMPDIVIADYHLDDGELGTEAVAMVREIKMDTPALVVTADTSELTARTIRSLPAELLHKPIRPGGLRATICHLLTQGA